MDFGIAPEDLALIVAGVLAPFVITIIKEQLGFAGKAALYLAFGVAALLGLGVAVVTGTALPFPGSDPTEFAAELLKLGGVVFTLATLIYKTWLAEPPK